VTTVFFTVSFDVAHEVQTMKKRKKTEQSTPDFAHRPFRSLKNMAPASKPVGDSAGTRVPQRTRVIAQEDEHALFLQAVEGTRRIGHGGEASVPSPDQQKKKKTDPGEGEENHLFLSAMQIIGANIADAVREREMDEAEPRSTTSRMRQLKRGTIRITRQLDLHGLFRDEALQRLRAFIVKAFNEGQRAVLVITGKGINSPEGPVLQGAVDKWLQKQVKGMVAEFSSAPRTYGGKGAFVVFLKRRDLAETDRMR
jgi:DNA-nicking Smr family endonuclease